MKEQDQIKAIAELDGWEYNGNNNWSHHDEFSCETRDFDYLHSYDAIIPVIQKQSLHVKLAICKFFFDKSKTDLCNMLSIVDTTPFQLCEALLRATGKWKA